MSKKDEVGQEKTLAQELYAPKPEKRKAGRPKMRRPGDNMLVTKETRVPLGGYRDILTVENTDPDYHYYWELDDTEHGNRLYKRRQAGYDFVSPDEGVIVGEASVFKTADLGSIIRVPNGDGRYLYLMKILRSWYEEDRAKMDKLVDDTEESIRRPNDVEGGYGSTKISRY